MAAVEEIFDSLGKMTVLELVELKNKIEEEWGITAAAPVAVAAPGAAAGGGDGAVDVDLLAVVVALAVAVAAVGQRVRGAEAGGEDRDDEQKLEAHESISLRWVRSEGSDAGRG